MTYKTIRIIGGKKFQIYETFSIKSKAVAYAKKLRTKSGSVFKNNMTLARIIDMGKASETGTGFYTGRVRYGVFVTRGKRT